MTISPAYENLGAGPPGGFFFVFEKTKFQTVFF